MAHVDPRRRTTHQLFRQVSDNAILPPELALEVVGSNAVLALSICAAKYWLLSRGVGSLWLSINVLAGGGVGALIWLVAKGNVVMRGRFPWKTLLVTSATLLAQQIPLFYSLKRLDASRIVFWSPFSAVIVHHILRTHSRRSIFLAFAGILSTIYIDAALSNIDFSTAFKAYIGLVVHSALQVATSHTAQHLSNSFETPRLAWMFTILSAAITTIPIHLLGRTIGALPPYPYVPLLALIPLPLLSFMLLFYIPSLSTSTSVFPPRGTFKLGFSSVAVALLLLSPLFSRPLAISDFVTGIIAFFSLRPPRVLAAGNAKSASEPMLRLLQGYLNTILSNPESKKIFYFLVVNMAYMLIQMLYGVWTNSLGLISDAIHMAFDCMAIAMGLFASVMATWTPNESFTYGYSRIETLSGFANGIFLILISVFIVVEAIQRLLDPPEMNTRQLLLVSTVGLAVNLFGMFAMGGHHHHGHSHSHGHDHSDDSHQDHQSHSHDHSGHSHDHVTKDHHDSHAHSHDCESHSEDDAHSHDHDHSSGHSHSHTHEHEHEEHHHSHSHSKDHGSSTFLSPEINLGSPTTNTSPLPHSPTVPSSGPYTPVTPSYSFTNDFHLKTHHPETAHSHSHSASRSREGHSHNMRGVFLHVMADTLGSVGVIISTILINTYGWTGFDPIASLFIAILIAASVVPLVMDTGRVLALDLGGKEVEVERALQEISGVWGVSSYSNAKFWPLEQGRIVGSIHVQIIPGLVGTRGDSDTDGESRGPSKLDRIRDNVEHVLKSRIKGLEELIVQLDG